MPALLAPLAIQPAIAAPQFRNAMRQLAGGISVITAGRGDDISGLTVTSVASLSAEPPSLIFCLNRSSSTWPILNRYASFGVNVISPEQQHVAERFSGRHGEKGAERYAGADWISLATGTPLLSGAIAVLDCTVEETIDRPASSIVIGRVVALQVQGEAATPYALAYWRGAYGVLR